MTTLNPKIYEYLYPARKRGSKERTGYWLVKCQLPGGGTHQSKHASEADAGRERIRLIREHGGGGVSADQFRDFELAQRRLETCQGPARGKGILEAVDFFIAGYRDHTSSPLVSECIRIFQETHVKGKRFHTQEEYGRYLPKLEDRFGRFRISEIDRTVLSEYVGAHPTSAWSHRKCLVSFFGFCSGTSRKLRNPTPWVKENEARWIPVPAPGPDKEIVIFTIEEVKSLLAMALIYEDLPYWVWCFFTGMRPCETQKFWTRSGYGWDRINLDGNFIVVNSEIAKTKKRRKIIIRPNLKKWLLFFKENEERMYPTCHRLKFRKIKEEFFSKEACKVGDVIRHTFISFRAVAFDGSLAGTAAESGNSEAIILKYYLDLIADQKHVEEFWSLVPSTFGLPEATESHARDDKHDCRFGT